MSWLANILNALRRAPEAEPQPADPVPEPAAPLAIEPPPLRTGPLAEITRLAIDPALALLPAKMDTPRARVMLLAICGQEADFRHRWQIFDASRPERMGAARGLWQFERGGGVRGVLRHAASAAHARAVCAARAWSPTETDVYNCLHLDDVLAAAFARLLLWTDPRALPDVGDVEGAWQLYLRTWRPGAYTRGTEAQRAGLRAKWGGYYAQAVDEVAP